MHVGSYIIVSWGIMFALIILGMVVSEDSSAVENFFLTLIIIGFSAAIVGVIMLFVNSVEYIVRSLA